MKPENQDQLRKIILEIKNEDEINFIVKLLRAQRKNLNNVSSNLFKVGDNIVAINAAKTKTIQGKILKTNPKNAVVFDEITQKKWNVPYSLLSFPQDNA